MIDENKTPEHLEEVSTRERIDLVQDDKARRYGQLIIAGMLIIFCIGYLVWYALFKADTAFQNMMAIGFFALASAGIGAGFAIFGLGRTVGRKQ